MTNPLPLRVTVNDSQVVLPDGLVFTLFIPAGRRQIATGVLRILDQYWAMPQVNPPTQVFRRGEEYEPCTAKILASVRRRLEKGTRSHFMVTLRDGEEPAYPAYRFEYYGTEAERDANDDSYVEVWFPTGLSRTDRHGCIHRRAPTDGRGGAVCVGLLQSGTPFESMAK
ncbi:MAG: hypothetical protein QM784_38080 [Polyangiaceae bacterium]